MKDWKNSYNEAVVKMLDCSAEEKKEYERFCRKLVKENFPKSFYKYSYFDDNEYWKKLLLGEVFFQHPYCWNDLFDSACTFEYDTLLKEIKNICSNEKINFDVKSFEESIVKKIRKVNLEKTFSSETNEYNPLSLLSTGEKSLPENLKIRINELLTKIEFCAIYTHVLKAACFSEELYNMKMWYYYSKEYTGFCVEFDFSNLNDSNIKPIVYTNKKFVAKNWQYSFYETEIFLPLLLKNPCWRDENEWRFIYPNKITNDLSTIANCPIKAIYLGNKISDEKKKEVFAFLESIKKPLPKIYKMVTNKYTNDFFAEEINLL